MIQYFVRSIVIGEELLYNKGLKKLAKFFSLFLYLLCNKIFSRLISRLFLFNFTASMCLSDSQCSSNFGVEVYCLSHTTHKLLAKNHGKCFKVCLSRLYELFVTVLEYKQFNNLGIVSKLL